MPKSNFKNYVTLAAATFITLTSLAACSFDRKIDHELTGTVIDSTTNKPIEGAYVVIAYLGGGGVAGGHNSTWCQATLGAYTQADGKFRFPALYKNMQPVWPTAIKPDYQHVKHQIVNLDRQLNDRKTYLQDQNVLLAPQDKAKPNLNFQSVEAHCAFAQTKQDAAAGLELLKLERTERIKYGTPLMVGLE